MHVILFLITTDFCVPFWMSQTVWSKFFGSDFIKSTLVWAFLMNLYYIWLALFFPLFGFILFSKFYVAFCLCEQQIKMQLRFWLKKYNSSIKIQCLPNYHVRILTQNRSLAFLNAFIFLLAPAHLSLCVWVGLSAFKLKLRITCTPLLL